MGTLYLHVGTSKTGSTSLHKFFCTNQGALENHGFCFPLFEQFPDRYARIRNARFLLECLNEAGRLACPLTELQSWRDHMDAIGNMSRTYPNILLMDDMLWWLSSDDLTMIISELKRAGDSHGFSLKVSVYLRRQDQYFTSQWSQCIKGAFHSDYMGMDWPTFCNKFIAEGRHDYFSHLECIAGIIGRENIIVRIYERGRFDNGDVVEDYLNALDLKMDDEYVRGEKEKNSSISSNMTEIRRIINTLPGNPGTQSWLLRRAAADCSVLSEEQKRWSMFTQQELDEFLALCEPSNRRIAQEYFGTDGPLFSPPGPLPPKWTPDNPDMYASIVRYFGAVVFAQQQEIEKLREEVTSKFFLRKKLRNLLHKIKKKPR